MLIDTFISIIDDSGTDAITSRNGGTLVEFSYTAISLIPDLKLLFAASEMVLQLSETYLHITARWISFMVLMGLPDQLLQPIVLPLKLLVPVDYPKISPVLVGDQWDEPLR